MTSYTFSYTYSGKPHVSFFELPQGNFGGCSIPKAFEHKILTGISKDYYISRHIRKILGNVTVDSIMISTTKSYYKLENSKTNHNIGKSLFKKLLKIFREAVSAEI